MGPEIVKAVSRPLECTVRDCSRISSESDGETGCCRVHWKTVGADSEQEIAIRLNEDVTRAHHTLLDRSRPIILKQFSPIPTSPQAMG